MIPLGILATTSGGAAAGAYELISTAYGTGSSGTITFSSIPQTYKHLQVRMTSKTTISGSTTAIYLRLNGISTGVYSQHILGGDGSSVQSGNGTSKTEIDYLLGAGNSDSLVAAASILDFADYASTSKNKTVRIFQGYKGSGNRIDLSSGCYGQTTAISSINLSLFSGSFTALTRVSLYGIKG